MGEEDEGKLTICEEKKNKKKKRMRRKNQNKKKMKQQEMKDKRAEMMKNNVSYPRMQCVSPPPGGSRDCPVIGQYSESSFKMFLTFYS